MKNAAEYSNMKCRVDKGAPGRTDVYFSETDRLLNKYCYFRDMLSAGELSRADQFHFKEVRQTYVISHGFLRMLLGSRLGMDPSEIIILRDANNKPFLKDHPIYFNLSHTKNAFAIVICPDFQIGVDLEKVNPCLDYGSVSGTVLNSGEQMYVEENVAELYDRFFLLWTRKEAYLKAVGTGITSDIWRIRSFQKRETLRRGFPEDRIENPLRKDFFVYSEKISDYFLSIAAPGRINIQKNIIDEAYCEKPEPLVLPYPVL